MFARVFLWNNTTKTPEFINALLKKHQHQFKRSQEWQEESKTSSQEAEIFWLPSELTHHDNSQNSDIASLLTYFPLSTDF